MNVRSSRGTVGLAALVLAGALGLAACGGGTPDLPPATVGVERLEVTDLAASGAW